MTFIQTELDRRYNPKTGLWDDVKYSPCPWGLRKLEDGSERCYYGNGVDKCKYFARYDWEQHAGCIACTCDLPRNDEVKIDERGNKYVIDNDGNEQLVFDF
jgi:hypothetical protein